MCSHFGMVYSNKNNMNNDKEIQDGPIIKSTIGVTVGSIELCHKSRLSPMTFGRHINEDLQ